MVGSPNIDRLDWNHIKPRLTLPLNDKVSHLNRKDVRLPQQLQRAMAAEAEAAREARAKVIAAEGEHKSSRALAHAAEVIAQSPAALQVNHLFFTFQLAKILFLFFMCLFISSWFN